MLDVKKIEGLKHETYEQTRKYLTWEDHTKIVKLLLDNGFWQAPASTKYHGDYPGGLAEHSMAVANNLVMLTDKLGLKWQKERSPFLVGLLHDVCKMDQYKRVEEFDDKFHYIKRDDSIFSHHGEKSICILASCITLTEEEIACIRWHMGAYETDTNEWKYYAHAMKKYPNVLWTHTADMMASHIDGV